MELLILPAESTVVAASVFPYRSHTMSHARFERTSDFARHKADAMVRCVGCERTIRLTSLDILKLFPMPVTLTVAKQRLRCASCGARDPKIAPVPRDLVG